MTSAFPLRVAMVARAKAPSPGASSLNYRGFGPGSFLPVMVGRECSTSIPRSCSSCLLFCPSSAARLPSSQRSFGFLS